MLQKLKLYPQDLLDHHSPFLAKSNFSLRIENLSFDREPWSIVQITSRGAFTFRSLHLIFIRWGPFTPFTLPSIFSCFEVVCPQRYLIQWMICYEYTRFRPMCMVDQRPLLRCLNQHKCSH
jgi:hypothetical protein